MAMGEYPDDDFGEQIQSQAPMSLNERGMKFGCIPYLPLSDLL
jgi:hypothetical protein